jgi:hypothetical protein
MSECQIKIRRFPLSTTDFTPIIAPTECSNFGIVGTEDNCGMIRSSDPGNPDAWYAMPTGYSYWLLTAHAGASRFAKGETLTFLKATGIGVGPVIVEFI